MIDTYGIDIQVRGASANAAAIGGVTDALGKAEQAGNRARDSMGRFIGSAKQGATAMDGASRSAVSVTRAFEGVTAAIAREQAMLEKINGPLRRYEQNLQTLDSLQRRGAVTTEQYAEQVRKLNRELERQSTIKVSAPQAPTAPKAGGLLGGAGSLAASAGLAFGLNELKNMAVGYQDLQNKMRVVAGDGESVSTVFLRIQASANASRSSLADTTAAYQRLTGATRELGMSSADTLRLTERISKAMKVSGASTAEAQAATQQLSQALASGRLQGDEFRSIGENAPYVLGLLSESLGVTRGKLRELASEGKLTSNVVVSAFERMGAKIDKDFAKTVPTLSDQWTMLQDKLTLVVGKLLEASGTFDVLGGALGLVGDVLGMVVDVVGAFKSGFDAALSSLGPFGDALRALANPVKLLRDGFAALKEFAQADAEAGTSLTQRWQDFAAQARGDRQHVAVADAKAYLAEMEALKKLHAEYERIDQTASTLDAARRGGVQGLPAFDADAAKASVALAQSIKSAFGVDVSGALDDAYKKSKQLGDGINKLKEQRAAQQLAEDIERAANAATGFNQTLETNARQWRALVDQERQAEQVLSKIAKDREALARATGQDPLVRLDSGVDALSRTRLELQTQRELRDVRLEMANVEYEYGATVVRVTKAEQERVDSMNDLKGALEGGRLSARAFLDEVKRMGDAAGESLDLMIKGLETAGAKLAAARPAPLAPSRQEIEANRLSRDLRIKQTYAEHQYGAVIVKNKLEELHRKDAIEDTNGALRVGGLSVKQYWEEMNRLGVEAGKATEILNGLRQPTIEWSQTITALNTLLRQGRIDLQQYNDQLAKLSASQPVRSGELPRGASLVGGLQRGGQEFAVGFEQLSQEQQDRADRRARPSTLEELGVREAIDTAWMDNIERKHADLKREISETKWLDDFAGKMATAAGALERPALLTKQWSQELELLKVRLEDDGIGRGLSKIRDEVTDVAGALETSLVNAFHNAEEALIQFVTTGEFSIKKFVDSALADMTRLMVRQAAMGLFSAIAGGGIASIFGSGATQGFAGMYGTNPGYAAELAGRGAGNVSDVAGSIGSIIPGFANGGSGRIAGSGPPDSRLFIARVTPGEHFRFTPPGQTPGGAAPEMPAAQVRVVVIDNDDKMRRFLETEGEDYHRVFERRSAPAKRGRTTGR